MLKIVLCIKQVPDTSDIKWTENNTIQREGLESIINPYDLYAIETALSLKNQYQDVSITALTMGPVQAENILRKALSLGVDDAFLLSDKKFAGADTYATGKTIASAISSKISDFDLIICGQFAVDGDTAQTGPSIANFLNIPQVTFVKAIQDYSDGYLTAVRELESGLETVKVKAPALICMLKNDVETSRAKINGIVKAQKFNIKQYGIEDISLNIEDAGLKGSPTYVNKAFRAPKRDVECRFFNNTAELANAINICRGENG